MIFSHVILCALIAIVAWYYFNKFKESEKEYYNLHKKFVQMCHENIRCRSRIKDLQLYKDDVSKTFQILDNELLLIKDRITSPNRLIGQINSGNLSQIQEGSVTSQRLANRISLMTPNLLNQLFSMGPFETETIEDPEDSIVVELTPATTPTTPSTLPSTLPTTTTPTDTSTTTSTTTKSTIATTQDTQDNQDPFNLDGLLDNVFNKLDEYADNSSAKIHSKSIKQFKQLNKKKSRDSEEKYVSKSLNDFNDNYKKFLLDEI